MRGGTVAKAYELARSGQYREMKQLVSVLEREGFDRVHEHLRGSAIRKDLVKLLRAGAGSPLVEVHERPRSE